MKFWDASAIIPLCIDEHKTPILREIAKKDGSLVVWWGSIVESYSAFARLFRDGELSSVDEANALAVLSELSEVST